MCILFKQTYYYYLISFKNYIKRMCCKKKYMEGNGRRVRDPLICPGTSSEITNCFCRSDWPIFQIYYFFFVADWLAKRLCSPRLCSPRLCGHPDGEQRALCQSCKVRDWVHSVNLFPYVLLIKKKSYLKWVWQPQFEAEEADSNFIWVSLKPQRLYGNILC